MSDPDLRVLAVSAVKHAKRTVAKPLPNPPFCMCVVAPPRSGKSTLIVNMIRNRRFNYKWGVIAIISPTAEFDATYQSVAEKDGVIIHSDPSLMDDLIAAFCESQEASGMENDMLLVVDDCVGYMGRGLEQIASRYRHYKISVIVASQQFRMLPPTLRTCAGYWILYKTHNAKEVDKMNEEFSGQFPSFLVKYQQATEEKYHFMFLDVLESTMYMDFTTQI